ncbi:hypothetical protein GW916_13550 [bacterium]|nr:hypothetical protein [bacterium]
MKRILTSISLGLLMLTMVPGCSQGRKSLSAGSGGDRLSEVVLLDYNEGDPVYGNFQLQLNLDKNFAYLDVLALANGWTPNDTYKVFARYKDEYTWVKLATGLNAGPGQTVQISAYKGHKIYEYTAYIIAWEYREAYTPFADNDVDSYMVQEEVLFQEYILKNSPNN